MESLLSSFYYQYTKRVDAIYVTLDSGNFAYTVDLDHRRHIDLDASGRPIGVELLNVSKGVRLADLPRADELARELERAGIKVLVAP